MWIFYHLALESIKYKKDDINNNMNKIIINTHFPPVPLVPAKGNGKIIDGVKGRTNVIFNDVYMITMYLQYLNKNGDIIGSSNIQ